MAESIRNFVCIVCPKGCNISVKLIDSEIVSVSGAGCKRGEAYVRNEIVAPVRMLTTTAPAEGGGVVPVRTDKEIPKGLLFEAVKTISAMIVPRTAKRGYTLTDDLLGTGARVYTVADADRDE